MSSERGFTFAGRKFLRVQDSTIEHDWYTTSMIEEAGLGRLERLPGEDAKACARRILAGLVKNRSALELLGCLFIPEDKVPHALRDRPGEAWTPEIAEETGQFLAHLMDPSDKAKIQGLTLTLLQDFFREEIACLWATPTSLDAAIPTTTPESANDLAAGPG